MKSNVTIDKKTLTPLLDAALANVNRALDNWEYSYSEAATNHANGWGPIRAWYRLLAFGSLRRLTAPLSFKDAAKYRNAVNRWDCTAYYMNERFSEQLKFIEKIFGAASVAGKVNLSLDDLHTLKTLAMGEQA